MMRLNVLSSTCLALLLLVGPTACSKSQDSNHAADTKMVDSGSTDTSTGGAATTAPAAATGPIVAGDLAHGKQIFAANCAACHGATGVEGGVGPSLKGEKAKKNLTQTDAWIKNPAPPMPKLYPAQLNDKDVADVATYVQSL